MTAAENKPLVQITREAALTRMRRQNAVPFSSEGSRKPAE